MFGYAAVIFNNAVFQPHMNALSKLVIFSSLIHQLGFLLFSTLDFAIGTVQDAGLIFLSTMSNTIANRMVDDGETEQAILSTTLVLLSAGTALLGLVLVAIGRLKLANAVSYLPMPVVGGYLAYIGYFCIQAGVALCISQPLIAFQDWAYLAVPKNLVLALPGLLAGLVLTWVSRASSSDSALPVTMVLIPCVFYLILYVTGVGIEGAREGDWVGEVAPPVPFTDLFQLVDFGLVRWDLIGEILWTWIGMVFVVSFASCLDVAAISMDMGEALDTNKELATVGICNFMSGLSFGFTGSYIFSQTLFTFRTGVHSRWVGFLIMVAFMYVVVSPFNILQVAPLFFLGSTLIFIGYDLFLEWLIEIRHRVLLSEYLTIWGTFIAIQVVGIDFGIVVGILVAILDHVVINAQATAVNRVRKRSRAVWSKDDFKLLQAHGYHQALPKIVTLDIVGPVFFGSSLQLLGRLTEETGIEPSQEESDARSAEKLLRSPHTSSHLLAKERKLSFPSTRRKLTWPPQFVVLDLTQVSNLDASASRACLLQFARLCHKRGIVVCACGASPRIDWMLRSHDVSYDVAQEDALKNRIEREGSSSSSDADRILLFLTSHEALEFCESALLRQVSGRKGALQAAMLTPSSNGDCSLSDVCARILSSVSEEERSILRRLEGERYHEVVEVQASQQIFVKDSRSDCFYVVLRGAVANRVGSSRAKFRQRQQILSGAGLVSQQKSSSRSDLLDPSFLDEVVGTMWPVGGIFGYSDFLLERPRTFGASAAQNDTRVARFDRSHLNLLRNEDAELEALLNRVLLQVSILDLANCTCDDV